jgi:hypothetical protein
VVVHIYNPSTGRLRQENPEFKSGLQSEFKTSLGFIGDPALKNKKEKKGCLWLFLFVCFTEV